MRLFWAITVPTQIIQAIDADVAPMRARWPALRWTPPRNWHLTLAFLGQVEPDAVDPLAGAVGQALHTASAVEVALAATAGTAGGRAGVVWIPTVDDAQLPGLAERVRDAVAPIAPADRRRPFTGHLTLARIPRHQRVGRLAADVAAAYEGRGHRWTAKHVHLMSSQQSADGAVYRSQARIGLAPE